MNKLHSVLAVVVLAPLLAGCAPSPEKVCDHFMDLMRKDLGDQVETMTDEQIEKIEKDCVDDASKDKKSDAKRYAKRAKCVMAASSLDGLAECEKAEKSAKTE